MDDARPARRASAPDAFSPLCPGVAAAAGDRAAVRIAWPHGGARFAIDPEHAAAAQQLLVRVDAPAGVRRVELLVDGRSVARAAAPFVLAWTIAPGQHVMTARAGEGGAGESASVEIAVE